MDGVQVAMIITSANVPIYVALFQLYRKIGRVCAKIDMLPCSPKAFKPPRNNKTGEIKCTHFAKQSGKQ